MSHYYTTECFICHCHGTGPKIPDHDRNKESVCLKCLAIITKKSPEVAFALDYPCKSICVLCQRQNIICFNITSCGEHYIEPTFIE